MSKKFTVVLESCGNPDRGQYAPVSDPTTVGVDDLEEASVMCRQYIIDNMLGSGNWSGGQVFDVDGNLAAQISYNGLIHKVSPCDACGKKLPCLLYASTSEGQTWSLCEECYYIQRKVDREMEEGVANG